MDIEKLIREIEISTPTDQIMVNGVQVWPFIKIFFFDQLYVDGGTVVSLSYAVKLKLIKSLLFGVFKSEKHKKYLLFSSSLQRKQLNGIWYDKLISPIANKLPDHLIYEMPVYEHIASAKRPAENAKTSLHLRIKEWLVKRKLKNSDLNWSGRELLEELCNTHKVKINIDELAKRFVAQQQVAQQLIKKNPTLKAVFMVTPYMQMGYVYAFRKHANVDVVELQHGVINRSHFGYASYRSYTPELFPSQLWSWGEGVREIFKGDSIQFNQDQIHPIGHFYLDEVASKQKNTSITKSTSTFEHTVAVSLQDDLTGEKLIPWVINAAEEYSQIAFLLVPRKKTKAYYEANFDFPQNILFSPVDVYETILSTDFHMTVFSSCAIEAPALGRANIMVDIDGKAKAYYEAKLSMENTRFILDQKQLPTAISELADSTGEELKESIKHEIAPGFKTRCKELVTSWA